eukprot:Rhum_TRINITY_DN13955_c0_g2::Rhum_TRINITY_DN13955_c0_g2_i2::g.66233::m.66233
MLRQRTARPRGADAGPCPQHLPAHGGRRPGRRTDAGAPPARRRHLGGCSGRRRHVEASAQRDAEGCGAGGRCGCGGEGVGSARGAGAHGRRGGYACVQHDAAGRTRGGGPRRGAAVDAEDGGCGGAFGCVHVRDRNRGVGGGLAEPRGPVPPFGFGDVFAGLLERVWRQREGVRRDGAAARCDQGCSRHEEAGGAHAFVQRACDQRHTRLHDAVPEVKRDGGFGRGGGRTRRWRDSVVADAPPLPPTTTLQPPPPRTLTQRPSTTQSARLWLREPRLRTSPSLATRVEKAEELRFHTDKHAAWKKRQKKLEKQRQTEEQREQVGG